MKTCHSLDCVHEHLRSLAHEHICSIKLPLSQSLPDLRTAMLALELWSVVIANRATSSYSYWWELKGEGKWWLKTSWSIHWHPYHTVLQQLMVSSTGQTNIQGPSLPNLRCWEFTSAFLWDLSHSRRWKCSFSLFAWSPEKFQTDRPQDVGHGTEEYKCSFSSDMYYPESVKAVKRRRRGCAEKLVLQGEMTKRSADWKAFLTNFSWQDSYCVWSDDEVADKYNNKRVIILSEGHAYYIESDDQQQNTTVQELASLYSNQEETDSMVVLYCKYAHEQGYENVRVHSRDRDVFFILLHPAKLCHVHFTFTQGLVITSAWST